MGDKQIDGITMHRIFRCTGSFDPKTFSGIAKGMPIQPLLVEGLTALIESYGKAKGHSGDKEGDESATVGAIPAPQLDHSVGDAESMENTIISRLSDYAKAADTRRGELNTYHAQIRSMASKHDFPCLPHDLATYRTPPVTATLADQIGLHYGHALFQEKCIIHELLVQMEIDRLDALTDVIRRPKRQ
ncbi:hypothetical protein MMC22_009799 [Lobaria immixta]|nr:hypothetical protein [Lobaria immixta]